MKMKMIVTIAPSICLQPNSVVKHPRLRTMNVPSEMGRVLTLKRVCLRQEKSPVWNPLGTLPKPPSMMISPCWDSLGGLRGRFPGGHERDSWLKEEKRRGKPTKTWWRVTFLWKLFLCYPSELSLWTTFVSLLTHNLSLYTSYTACE